MSFYESPRFPDCVALGAQGGPGFLTDVSGVDGGHEFRNQVREKALRKWDVSHNAKRQEIWEPLLTFFLSIAGQFHGFRFKDHLDYQALAGQGTFTMLTATTYQMWKLYSYGSLTYLRMIQKPVVGTVTVTGGTSPVVNYTTGIVTVSSGLPTSWVGQFDVPVRFGTDQMEQETVTRNDEGDILVHWRAIPIVEIRV